MFPTESDAEQLPPIITSVAASHDTLMTPPELDVADTKRNVGAVTAPCFAHTPDWQSQRVKKRRPRTAELHWS